MSKVIAILEEPESCMFCEFGTSVICGALYNYKTNCRPSVEYSEYDIYDHQCNRTKPDWCPLKKIPDKDNECYFPDEYMDGYANGWNACLDKIFNDDEHEF